MSKKVKGMFSSNFFEKKRFHPLTAVKSFSIIDPVQATMDD